MTDRYSHPAEDGRSPVDLTDHLADVAHRVRLVVPEDKTSPFGSSVAETVSSLAWTHDFGKLTTWFQDHIEGKDPAGPSHHSPIGALLTYHVLEEMDHAPEECLAGYVAVARHHGLLPDVAEYVFDRTAWNQRHPEANRRKREILEQIHDIDDSASDLANEIVRTASGDETTWNNFATDVRSKELFERIKSRVSTFGATYDTHGIPPTLYPTLIQFWSALIVADKTSAAHAPKSGLNHDVPSRTTLASFIDDLSAESEDVHSKEARLNEYRGMAREGVLENARTLISNGDRLATITLPTGMGKTLTGLDAALTIRDATERNRVVYALPFTSIIDQVVDEVSDIFETDATDNLLTVHHHLAETTVKLENKFDDLDDESDEYARIEEILGESWRSGLVVTTFVQLFESLAGPANTQSMKLPALYDSVVILDEPQSLPHDWWPLVDRLVEILTTEYNAVVVAMTATQPRVFDNDATELVDDPQAYFGTVERTEYLIDESIEAFPDAENGPIDYREAARKIAASATSDEDILAVCNTIDSAIELTDAVRDRIMPVDVGRVLEQLLTSERVEDVTGVHLADRVENQTNDVALVHLSTRIRPRDRLVLVNAIKELTERDCPIYVISTQLIEAGVDVSFDRVFRDFAPIDNVVQAAGRCNRSFERDQGTVTLWWLDAPGSQDITPGEAVYDKWGESLLRVTNEVLKSIRDGDSDRIDESSVAWDGVREYYRSLIEDRHVGKREYVEYVETSEAASLNDLSLIEQRLAVEVIVCRTSQERQTIEDIRDAWRAFDFSTVNTLLEDLRTSQVSIPIYRSDSEEARALGSLEFVHPETDIRMIDTSKPEYDGFFDPVTGFVVPDNTVERRFL